jgi:hypothetical protein
MIPIQEAAGAIYGAWRLARLDPSGLSWFNATEEGFWRSFYAAVLTAPVYALTVAIEYAQEPPVSEARLLAVHAIAYVMSWTAFPLAMAWAARRLGREGFYMRYVIARNWAMLLERLLFLPAVALAATGLKLFVILPALAAFVNFAYQWYVARTALSISGFQATAVIGLDVLIDLAIGLALHALLPGAPI